MGFGVFEVVLMFLKASAFGDVFFLFEIKKISLWEGLDYSF